MADLQILTDHCEKSFLEISCVKAQIDCEETETGHGVLENTNSENIMFTQLFFVCCYSFLLGGDISLICDQACNQKMA